MGQRNSDCHKNYGTVYIDRMLNEIRTRIRSVTTAQDLANLKLRGHENR
jgi:hypothetical protein